MIKKGTKYKLILDASGQSITYQCEIISVEGDFIEIEDKFGHYYLINKFKVISLEVQE